MKVFYSILLACFIIIFFKSYSFGQTVIEAASTDENFFLEMWWVKSFDPEYKLTLFNLNTAEYNYDLEESILMSYSVVSYDAFKGFGPAVGTRVLSDRLVALGGLQYNLYNEKFFVTANFTSEFKGNPDFELFSIIQYRPKFGKKIKGFLQGQLSLNFNADMHLLSFQQLRLGTDFGLIQTGLALNQLQSGADWEYDFQPGLFLRLEFQ